MVKLNLNSKGLAGNLTAFIPIDALTYLDLHINSFSGYLPSQLWTLTKLQFLSLYINRFTGSLPSTIGSMKSLTYADFGLNSLTGSLPSQLGLLTKLQVLYLNVNNFTSAIPESFCSFSTTMIILELDSNSGLTCLPSCLNPTAYTNLKTDITYLCGTPTLEPSQLAALVTAQAPEALSKGADAGLIISILLGVALVVYVMWRYLQSSFPPLPGYDVFISYRVKDSHGKPTADSKLAEMLYNKLTAKGVRVWWDVKCIQPGQDWEVEFIKGLVESRSLLPIVSRNGVDERFETLKQDSPCDNVLLEYRLALELRARSSLKRNLYIQLIYPVFVGDVDASTLHYRDYFTPTVKNPDPPVENADPPEPVKPSPSPCVSSVEEKFKGHLKNQELGPPATSDLTVAYILGEIKKCQGGRIITDESTSLSDILDDKCSDIEKMVKGIRSAAVEFRRRQEAAARARAGSVSVATRTPLHDMGLEFTSAYRDSIPSATVEHAHTNSSHNAFWRVVLKA